MSFDDRTEQTRQTDGSESTQSREKLTNESWNGLKAGSFSVKDLNSSRGVVVDDSGSITISDAFSPDGNAGAAGVHRKRNFELCTCPVDPGALEPDGKGGWHFVPREPSFSACAAPVDPGALEPDGKGGWHFVPRKPSFYACVAPADPDIIFPDKPDSDWVKIPDDVIKEELAKLRQDNQPDVTKAELAQAEAKLDKKIDANEANLSPREKEERKRLEHAILEGNTKEIEKIIREHKGNPEELNRVMALVSSDLREAGIFVNWQVGRMMMGDDKDFHPVGSLKIFRKGGERYLDMSTDSRIGTGLGGPITWTSDGGAIFNFMAYSGDPDQAMKDIGNSGVRALIGSGQKSKGR